MFFILCKNSAKFGAYIGMFANRGGFCWSVGLVRLRLFALVRFSIVSRSVFLPFPFWPVSVNCVPFHRAVIYQAKPEKVIHISTDLCTFPQDFRFSTIHPLFIHTPKGAKNFGPYIRARVKIFQRYSALALALIYERFSALLALFFFFF